MLLIDNSYLRCGSGEYKYTTITLNSENWTSYVVSAPVIGINGDGFSGFSQDYTIPNKTDKTKIIIKAPNEITRAYRTYLQLIGLIVVETETGLKFCVTKQPDKPVDIQVGVCL